MEKGLSLVIASAAFQASSAIPMQYSCEGEDISPPLTWTGVSTEAKSLVLIVDDPDAPDPKAPKMTYVHWLLYNIPVNVSELPENVSLEKVSQGILEGTNDWQRVGYGGPCPPIGEHRYFFKLYTLDCQLFDLNAPIKAELEAAMAGHILQTAELVGTYEKKK